MPDLSKWQDKIKQKRSKTEFRDFLKEIVSWCPFVFNRNKGIISKFPDTNRIKICKIKDFNDNVDKLTEFGLDYDLNIDFFENYQKLLRNTKFPNFFHYMNNENCDYSEASLSSKNVYLTIFAINENENIFYSFRVQRSRNVYNSLFVLDNCDNVYFSRGIIESFNIFYSSYIKNSANIWFSSNLNGCKECVFCSNLDNVSYYIHNKKYEKEKYYKEIENILKNKDKYLEYYSGADKIGVNQNSSNVKGNFIVESENVYNGYYVSNNKNSRNVMFTGNSNGVENFNDIFVAGGTGGNDYYGIHSAGGGDNVYCSISISFCTNIFYSYFLENCSYCIGCIGLKNKSYCILNKQYTKDEWEKLSDKIFNQMETDGVLGDFFPGNLNPFYFNDTIAGLIGGFTKEEVVKDGYMWRDDNIKVDIPEGSEVITTDILNNYQGFNKDGKWEIDKEILKKVIKDKEGNYYRIVEMEYDFLVKHSLPLPEIHWVDRMKLNFGV